MHIAILMTNTDESPFAARHPRDGAKFAALLHLARPEWTCTVYPVKDGGFPDADAAFDGVLITGSPASVHDNLPWIAPLEALLRQIAARGLPIFGACFGHQILARAFGGRVGCNPDGMIMAAVDVDLAEPATRLRAFASHNEQVHDLPPGAVTIARGPGCPIAGFRLKDNIMTTQYHPEMTTEFFLALTDEMADGLGAEGVAVARAGLDDPPDRRAWAEIIAGFLESAR
ncbi:MAG: type 1 glutamine amidotransferase [Rhodobacteraceae bacterium]|nr:type 1 glutamine amidotransferase [Paracoccaceae bacterium]